VRGGKCANLQVSGPEVFIFNESTREEMLSCQSALSHNAVLL
jgi:hypothetical protein